jgi:hypothetical protein
VTGAKIANNSIVGTNIRLGTLGTVPSATNAGQASFAGAIDVPACPDNPCTPDKVGTSSAIATCPLGMVAIGGGGETSSSGVELRGSLPLTFSFAGQTEPNAWQVDVDNWLQSGSKVDYYVVCANAKSVDNPSGL